MESESESDSEYSAVTRDDTIALKESEWLSMKNRISSLVGMANVSNFRFVADQILGENIVAGRGLFCQSVILKSQSESPESSYVCAVVVAIINSRFSEVGYLLVKRAVLCFKAAHDSGDTRQMQLSSRFLAELVNQRVVYEYLGLDVLLLLMLNPSWNNIQIAVSFCRQCGSMLHFIVPHKLKEILSEFRRLLREGALEKRTQVLILRLLVCKRWKFKDVLLDFVVEYEDQITHDISVLHHHHLDSETSLDRFHAKSEADDHLVEEDEVSSRAP